jgi:hypothetical protein
MGFGQSGTVTAAQYERYADDRRVLGEIGTVLRSQSAGRPSRLPRELAEQAVAAWNRDEGDPLQQETPAQRELRDKAGTLALIGLSISELGWTDGDVIVVTLSDDLFEQAGLA